MSSKWDANVYTNTIQKYSIVADILEGNNGFPNYAYCLPRYAKLDGTFQNAPNDISIGGYGYISEEMSDSTGAFIVEPQITIKYARVKSSKGITLTFNEISGDYCSKLSVAYYRGDKLQERVVYEPNASEYFCSHQSKYYDRLVITFHETNKPYRYLWLSQFEQYRLVNGKGLEIVYEDLAVGAHDEFIPSVEDVKGFVDISSLKNTNEFPNYALCLPRYSKLDGTYENMSAFEQVGYISESVSDANGEFTTPPQLVCTFENTYTSVGISLQFNTTSKDYVSNIRCEWYRGDELLLDKTFINDSYKSFLNAKVTNYDKVVLSFIKTSKPFRNVFVTDIQFGLTRTFDNRTIRSASCLQEVNPISEELTINTLDFTIKSNTDIAFDFQQQQQCVLKFDDNVIGVFYIVGGKRTSVNEYEFNTEDIISMLDKQYAFGGFYNDTFKNVVTDILGDVEFYIDETLEDKNFTGYIPYGTKRECLQLVCFACGGVVDTSFDTKMFIYPNIEKENPIEITNREQYLGATSTESDTIVTGIQLEVNHYVANSTTRKLFGGNTTDTMIVTFSEPHHTYTITNGTINSFGDNWVNFTGTGDVVLNGCGYDNDTTTLLKENPAVTNNKNVAEVKDVKCVNSTNAQEIIQRLYSWYIGKSVTNASIIVGEHELSEFVSIDTFDGNRKGLITSMQYSFSTATMKADIKIE